MFADAVGVIVERTEGWVAGMQLARISLAGAQHRPPVARDWSGGDRMIADFLIDEVVSRQTPEIRDFLAVTALYVRITGTRCRQSSRTSLVFGSERMMVLARSASPRSVSGS